MPLSIEAIETPLTTGTQVPETGNPLKDADILYAYGLPFRKPGNDYLIERAVAQHYVYEYDIFVTLAGQPFSQRRAKMVEDQQWHMYKLAHYLIDYTILIASGEARHVFYKSNIAKTGCATCRQYFIGIGLDGRHAAAKACVDKFTSYPEALKVLNHCFNDHPWTCGHGNWRWGNVTYIASLMYEDIASGNWTALKDHLDLMLQLQHNGGCAFQTKFAQLPVSGGMLYMILWAKYEGKPCCISYLRKQASLNGYTEGCEHAIARMMSMTYDRARIRHSANHVYRAIATVALLLRIALSAKQRVVQPTIVVAVRDGAVIVKLALYHTQSGVRGSHM